MAEPFLKYSGFQNAHSVWVRNVIYGIIVWKIALFHFAPWIILPRSPLQPFADPESYVTVKGWRADNGPTLNAGLVALWFFRRSGPVLLRNPNFFVIFQGVWTPCPPSGSAHDNQGSVLKVPCQTCGNIGDITSKKYAEEKSKTNRDYLKTILLSIWFSHAPRNIFSSKKSWLKSGPKRIKNPLKTHIEALEIQILEY